MSSGLEDGELKHVIPWVCICGFSTTYVHTALYHIEYNHKNKTLEELTQTIQEE